MVDLTSKQQLALNFIREAAVSKGSPPTLRELCDFMGYKSIGSAQDVVQALRKKGYLQNSSSQKARSLLVTELGRNYGSDHPEEVADLSFGTLTIPCLGQIPAGNPLEAISEQTGTLKIASSFVKKAPPEKLFALRASGQSMQGAGILDGDWLVIKSTQHADTGDIVVAQFNEGEATVKRLEKDKKGWYLKPENPQFFPVYAHDSVFTIVGVVIALQRSL